MSKPSKRTKRGKLQIIPLGGLGEVGRNMMALNYKGKILIIDMGFRMPEEDMPGIDYIIPNISYFRKKKRKKKILGVVFTHGHYDHIGAVPYMVHKLGNPPLFASKLTAGIIKKRQQDFSNRPKLRITKVKDGSKISLGPFDIEFFRINHNIVDNLGLFIKTPVGNIVHPSDFKFDKTPIYDKPTDFKKLKRMGKKGVTLLMSDSTGAEEKGHSLSEKKIFENLDKIFKEAPGRIVAATFSSLINRIQQIISLSEKYKRKVAIAGYSMETNIEICKNLGYIKSKKKTLISPKEMSDYPDSKVTLLCTGAQGEESATLMKIANREFSPLKLKGKDTVIFSSSVVPGNERTVQIMKDDILRQGAKVFHYKMMDIHASGHAHQGELKRMIQIMDPKFFLPLHGQYSMLVKHAEIAKELGIPKKNVIVAENGQIIDLTSKKIKISKKTAPSHYVMVDGLGIGDVGKVVLRDRKNLARDGMFVIVALVDGETGKVKGSPDIISRGFVYLKESKKLLKDTRKKIKQIVDRTAGSGKAINWSYIRKELRNKIGDFLFKKTKRRPIVLPVVIEV